MKTYMNMESSLPRPLHTLVVFLLFCLSNIAFIYVAFIYKADTFFRQTHNIYNN